MESSPRRPVQAGNSSLGADGAAAELNSQALSRACGTDRQAVLPGDTAVRAAPGPGAAAAAALPAPTPASPAVLSAVHPLRGTRATDVVLQRGLNVPPLDPTRPCPSVPVADPGGPRLRKAARSFPCPHSGKKAEARGGGRTSTTPLPVRNRDDPRCDGRATGGEACHLPSRATLQAETSKGDF